MKKLIILLLLIATVKICPSQVTFDKTYDFWEDMKLTDVLPVEDGYYITGHIETIGGFYFLIKTDLYGDTIFTKKYFSDQYLYGDNPELFKRNSQALYLVYNEGWAINLQKINLNGDTIFTKKIDDLPGLYDVIWSSEGHLVLLASDYINLYIIKSDTNGNIIGKGNCNIDEEEQYTYGKPSSILEIPNGEIKASVNFMYQESFWYDQTLFSFNDSCIYSYRLKVASPLDDAALHYMLNFENDIIAIGTNLGGKIYASRLNSHGDTLWIRHYLSNFYGIFIHEMTKRNENSFVMSGTMVDVSNNFTLGLISFNVDGDLLWWRVYNYEGYESVVNDISLCPDGGFAVVGFIEALPETKGKFIKTDDMGLISGPGISETDKNIDIHIYPNPATNMLYVESPVEIESVSIFNSLGATLELWNSGTLEQHIAEIPLTGLPPGLYLVRVETAGGVVAGKVVVE